jgi:hypothetical protein
MPHIGCREGFISLTRNKWIARISTSTAHVSVSVYQSVIIDRCVRYSELPKKSKNLSFVIVNRLRLSGVEFNSSCFEA